MLPNSSWTDPQYLERIIISILINGGFVLHGQMRGTARSRWSFESAQRLGFASIHTFVMGTVWREAW